MIEGFELKEGYAVFRPSGPTTVPEFLGLLEQAMKACQATATTRLIMNVTQLTYAPLTLADRFTLGEKLAAFWDRRIRLVFLPREGQRDPEGFASFVAHNRGLRVGIEGDEAAALSWLLSDAD